MLWKLNFDKTIKHYKMSQYPVQGIFIKKYPLSISGYRARDHVQLIRIKRVPKRQIKEFSFFGNLIQVKVLYSEIQGNTLCRVFFILEYSIGICINKTLSR